MKQNYHYHGQKNPLLSHMPVIWGCSHYSETENTLLTCLIAVAGGGEGEWRRKPEDIKCLNESRWEEKFPINPLLRRHTFGGWFASKAICMEAERGSSSVWSIWGEITSKAQSSKLIATDARMSGYSVPPSLAFFILWNNAIVIISPIRLAFACHCLFISKGLKCYLTYRKYSNLRPESAYLHFMSGQKRALYLFIALHRDGEEENDPVLKQDTDRADLHPGFC